MHFFSSTRIASRYRSFIISALLQLIRSIDCLNNLVFPADSRIVGIYEKFPVVCDEEYRSKYTHPELQAVSFAGARFVPQTVLPEEINRQPTTEQKPHADRPEVLEFDYDSDFLQVDKTPPEFLTHDQDESSEFMNSQDETLEFRRNVPSLWNFTDTSEVFDLEDDGNSQKRFLRDSTGEEIERIKRHTKHRTQIIFGKDPRSLPKKGSFSRCRKSNRKFNVEEEIFVKPYTIFDTFGSILNNRRDSLGNFRANLRQAGWSEDNCKSLRRIVGGHSLSSPEELPYMVFVDTGCGGAIVSDIWVLTAGHCVDEDDPKYVHTGSLDLLAGCQYNVVHVYAHPRFTRESLEYDVALLKISPSFVFSPAIKPIRMSETKVRRKTCGVVAGWGAETYKGSPKYKLTMTMIPVVARKRCRMFGIKQGQFCAGYQDASSDACQGDSGGPFVINGIVVGIVSFGYKCATPNTPGVYVDISYHRHWIRSVAGI